MSATPSLRHRLGPVLLGWGPLGVMLAGVLRANTWSWTEAVTLTAGLCLVGAPLFASARFLAQVFPLRPSNAQARWATWTVGALTMGGLWSGSGWVWGKLLASLPGLGGLPARIQPVLPVLTGFGILIFLAHLGLSYLLQAQAQAQAAEAQQGELRRLALDAELKALRAQINPHFLFNSLNSISALTTLDPGKAREMCVLLSDFLRKSLGLGERASVSLREELELLRTYLAIEQVRFGERLRIDWEVEPEAEALMLPPLLLQPLAENAIKHGISTLTEGGTLRIAAHVAEDAVTLEVANPCDPDAEPPKGLGLGLRQVRERLKGRFGSESRFDAHTDACQHIVTLTLPLEQP